MKKIIIITLFLYGVCSVYSQTDTLLIEKNNQGILALQSQIKELQKQINDLKSDKQTFNELANEYKKDKLDLENKNNWFKKVNDSLQIEIQKFSDLKEENNKNTTDLQDQINGWQKENEKLKNKIQNYSNLIQKYKDDSIASQNQINDLMQEIERKKNEISNLNKKKVVVERDKLNHDVDSLKNVNSKLNEIITQKEEQIDSIKIAGEKKAQKEKENGKDEILAQISNTYKNLSFDELIISSTKASVKRDKELNCDTNEVQEILSDLTIYLDAKESLSKKYNATQNKNISGQLEQIKVQSTQLNDLKVDIQKYKDYNNSLKNTIDRIVSLDAEKFAAGDTEIEKKKFSDIVSILSDYMYDWPKYINYPFLSNIVMEIIYRKKLNPDDKIEDLLKKL